MSFGHGSEYRPEMRPAVVTAMKMKLLIPTRPAFADRSTRSVTRIGRSPFGDRVAESSLKYRSAHGSSSQRIEHRFVDRILVVRPARC